MQNVIKLLTSQTCPYCPQAREVLRRLTKERKDVMVIELPVDTEQGMREALKYGIRSVPSVIINDRFVIRGVPRMDDLRRALEVIA